MTQSTLVTLLVAVIALLVSLLCGVLAGFLWYLDGGSVASSLMRAGGAFGACVIVCGAGIGLLLVV